MISIIASDMDGTLLNDKMQISAGNVAAIKAAQAQGVEFMVATGRSRSEALPLLAEGGLKTALITMNGAQVFNTAGESVVTIPIERADVLTVTDYLKKAGLYFELMTTNGNYSDSKVRRIQNIAELLADLNPDTSYKIAVALAAARLELMNMNYVTDYQSVLDQPDIDILKIIVLSSQGPVDLPPVREFCEQQPHLIVTSSGANNIEINHINAQKGLALAAYAKQTGATIDQTMAIGDNLNDESMIRMAGIGVAMGNAIAPIKQLANYQTAVNTQDGVAQAIYHALDLNQQQPEKK